MAYKDSEKEKAHKKAYYKTHREEFLAKAKIYYVAHREERKAHMRAYNKTYNATHREKKKICNAAHQEERKAYMKVWGATHQEERKIYEKIRHAARRKEVKFYGLKKRYGLSVIAFETMLNGQGGKCAICGTTEWGRWGPNVDHDHITGRVRGLICFKCNIALGYLEYLKKYVERVKNYLKRNNEQIR